MGPHLLVRKALGTVATGVIGVAVVDAARSTWSPQAGRRALVGATVWGIRGVRSVEGGAEHVRLWSGDVLAEAKEQLGEQATPPQASQPHPHEH